MAELELDIEWFLLYPAFALGTAVSLGVISADILPVINISDVFIEGGGVKLTIGRLLAIGALAGVIINRDSSISDTVGVIEVWIVYATLGLLIAPPFFPVFEETLASGLASVLSFVVQSIGFTIVAYLN